MFIRSFLFKIYFVLLTFIMIIFGVLLLPFPYKVIGRYVGFWGGMTLFGLRVFCNIRLEVRGQEHLPSDAPVIIACKHQSAFEAAGLFYNLLPYPVYALKAELDKIPLWRVMSQKAGALSVQRSKGGGALKLMIKQAQSFIAQKRSIVIFPEGTRNQAYTEGYYHPGIYALSRALPDTHVIPAAINSGICWPGHKKNMQSGTIILEFLPPMDNSLSRKDFMNALKIAIEQKTRQLELE